MAFRIDPESLYSRSELAEAFDNLGIDFDAFVRRAGVPRRLRQAYLGGDLLDALKALPTLDGLKRSHRSISTAPEYLFQGNRNKQQDPGAIAARMACAIKPKRGEI